MREEDLVTDPTLFKPGPALGNMSDNEQFVFDLLQTTPSGLSAFDIGRAFHIDGPYNCRTCNAERTCEWARPNAVRILNQLRARDAAIYRRSLSRWQPLVRAAEPAGEIPY